VGIQVMQLASLSIALLGLIAFCDTSVACGTVAIFVKVKLTLNVVAIGSPTRRSAASAIHTLNLLQQ
jgi:hypothetical protein